MPLLKKTLLAVITIVAGVSLLFSTAGAGAKKADCSSNKSLSSVVAKLKPGDTLLVSGVCNEEVLVPANVSEVTIDGQGQTTIDGGAAGTPLTIRGGNVTVKNLRVTGGRNGISVHRRGSATIDSVLVEGVGNNGIVIIQGSFGRIVNSIIQNNINGCAIVVSDNSAARIGFLTAADAAASPNVLQGNDDGVCVSSSSYAEVVGNNINGNTNHGVFVNTVSHADISSNAIDNNGGQGVQVGRNSGVNLGRDTGSGLFEAPNTTTANNGQFGVRCFINSYVDGRLGTLNGASGQTDFGSGCINSTLP